jgi:16S rRNA (adenine1518-N6/adenine1519-N6)-dimethyltransferase
MSFPTGSGSPPRRKRFGQHFLHDHTVLENIVAAISPSADDRLVEIGPGRGALTRMLLEAGNGSLDALEIDRDLVALLRTEITDYPRFVLHEVDALKFDFTQLARERGGRLRVVGNLPYNISTPLLFHLLDHASAIEDLHIMLQREVIARMASQPDEEDYGRLTIMLAPLVTIERLFDVGPGAFKPPPRVWSAGTRIRRKPPLRESRRGGLLPSAQNPAKLPARSRQPGANRKLRPGSGSAAGDICPPGI